MQPRRAHPQGRGNCAAQFAEGDRLRAGNVVDLARPATPQAAHQTIHGISNIGGMACIVATADVEEEAALHGAEEAQYMPIAWAIEKFRPGNHYRQPLSSIALGHFFSRSFAAFVRVAGREGSRFVGWRPADRTQHTRAADIQDTGLLTATSDFSQDVFRATAVQPKIFGFRHTGLPQHPGRMDHSIYAFKAASQALRPGDISLDPGDTGRLQAFARGTRPGQGTHPPAAGKDGLC